MLDKLLMTIVNFSKKIENDNSFDPAWYSIFFNPFFITRRRLRRNILEASKKYFEDVNYIVDVGCGLKPYRNLFSAKRYIGVEVAGGGHSDDKKTVDRWFDGKRLPFANNSVDGVVLFEVLEHVPEPLAMIKEIKRILRPKGVLLSTTPFVWPEHEIPYDYQRLTQYGHKLLLKNGGLKVNGIIATSGTYATVGQIVSDFLAARIYPFVKARKLKYFFEYFLTIILLCLTCGPIQIFSEIMEKLVGRNKGITLDYLVIAQK